MIILLSTYLGKAFAQLMLSQSQIEMNSCSDSNFQKEVDAYFNLIINNLPATDARLKEIQSQQNEDPVCQKLQTYCQEGWPDKSTFKGPFKPYIAVASELCVADADLLFLLRMRW